MIQTSMYILLALTAPAAASMREKKIIVNMSQKTTVDTECDQAIYTYVA